MLQVVVLFGLGLQGQNQLRNLLLLVYQLLLIVLHVLCQLDIFDLECAVLSDEFADFVLECIEHALVEFLLALKLLHHIIIHLLVLAAAFPAATRL